MPLLIYDGKCGFCRIWIDYWKRLTGDRLDYAASQDVGHQYPQIPQEAFAKSVQLVRDDGSVASGARAVFESLGYKRLYESLPVLTPLLEFAYRVIATHRGFFYWVTRLAFGKRIEPARFAATQWLFLRALAIVYAIAFGSLAVQIRGLLGERGVAPAGVFFANVAEGLGAERYFAVPSIFWLNSSDLFLQVACWLGVAFAAVLLLGRLERLMLVSLYLLYLSFALAGQDFLLFKWDALLLESGFLAIFFGRTLTTQRTVAWLFRWLVLRLYFLSAWVKIASQDPAWSGFTALDFHYWTQPLPNVVSWYAAQLPSWFQHASTLAVLAIEFGVPALILMPRRLRTIGGLASLSLQGLIFLTGNYTFFNLLTAALTLFLFDDQALRRVLRWRPRLAVEPPPTPRWARIASALLAAMLLTLGLSRIVQAVTLSLPAELQEAATYSAPFQLVNSYGLFAVMTTTRPEIIIEGSRDGAVWLAYEFRYKPGDVKRAPPWVAPHQPRLDWQMWFAALSDFRTNSWFLTLAQRLLEGSPDVLALMKENPFPETPPRYIRAQLYRYRFTDAETRRRTGAWWVRDLQGPYLPAIGLRQN